MNKKLILKKLLYRSTHRGCKEMDIIFGDFAQQNLATLSDMELLEYEKLLEISDDVFYKWIVGLEAVASEYNTTVFYRIKKFHEQRKKV